MPKDEWAAASSRALGRRKLATGEFYRVGLKRAVTRRGRRPHRKQRQGTGCPCGSLETTLTPQTFSDGQQHTRVTCADCGRFVKWL